MQLSLLGPIRISIGADRQIDLPVRKEEALLAYLALEHSHAHSRESLIGLLWPDAPVEKARLSLRANLPNLRKRLQGVDVDALLRVTSWDIQWVADACYRDTVEFSHRLRSGDRHEHRRHELCDRCAPAFSRTVALYRGTFLNGLYLVQCQSFDEWLFLQRERFRVQVLDALKKLTAFHLRGGEGEQALSYARIRYLTAVAANRQIMEIWQESEG